MRVNMDALSAVCSASFAFVYLRQCRALYATMQAARTTSVTMSAFCDGPAVSSNTKTRHENTPNPRPNDSADNVSRPLRPSTPSRPLATIQPARRGKIRDRNTVKITWSLVRPASRHRRNHIQYRRRYVERCILPGAQVRPTQLYPESRLAGKPWDPRRTPPVSATARSLP